MAFSPDGFRIASGGGDATVRIRDEAPEDPSEATSEPSAAVRIVREAMSRPDPFRVKEQLAKSAADKKDFATNFWRTQFERLSLIGAKK